MPSFKVIKHIVINKHVNPLRWIKQYNYLVLSKYYHDPAENLYEVQKQIHGVPSTATTNKFISGNAQTNESNEQINV